MLRARLRAISGWSDACILNVSSRGLMINASAPVKGDSIELWHGEYLIIATVVWKKGTRAGLHAEGRLPVDDILALSKSPSLRLTAGSWPEIDRRKTPRIQTDSRARARATEFAGIVVIAACLTAGAVEVFERAFATPINIVQVALER
jgi:hypothetical protein